MQLVYKYTSKDAIPEGAAQFYKEKDGAWYLQVTGDGIKTQDDVDRVKTALQKQRDINEDLEKDLAKYKNVDLNKWDKLKDYDPDADPGEGDFDKKVSDKVRAKQAELEAQYQEKLTKAQQDIDQAEQKARDYVKESWKRKMLSEKFGFEDSRRLNDFLRALKDPQDPDFAKLRTLVDSIEVTEDGGQYTVVGGDLKDADGAKEVLAKLAAADVAKHYIPAPDNTGGDSRNNGKTGDNAGNPYKKDTWNVTRQGELEATDMTRAKALAQAAGVDI